MPLALKELYEKEKETGQKSMFDWDNLLVAPSELPNRWLPEIIHRPLTEGEILEYVDAYGKTAKLCMETGFDGVEVHAVHEGYLLDQLQRSIRIGEQISMGGLLITATGLRKKL